MASTSALSEYEQDRLDTIVVLQEDGFQASFGSKGQPVNHTKGADYTEKCKEYVFPLLDTKNFADIIKSEDTAYIVSNENNLVHECEFMDDAGKKIAKVIKFPEHSPVTIFYEVLVRG